MAPFGASLIDLVVSSRTHRPTGLSRGLAWHRSPALMGSECRVPNVCGSLDASSGHPAFAYLAEGFSSPTLGPKAIASHTLAVQHLFHFVGRVSKPENTEHTNKQLRRIYSAFPILRFGTSPTRAVLQPRKSTPTRTTKMHNRSVLEMA